MSYNNITIRLAGLSDFENLLLSFEPEVVKAQTEVLKDAAKEAIELVRNGIPGNWVLRNHLVAYIAYYKKKKLFFLSVGIGNESIGTIRKETDRRSFGYQDPLRYGRWQEWGWKPEQWNMNFDTGYEQGYTRWSGEPRSIDSKTGMPRYVDVRHNVTIDRRFVSGKKSEVIRILEQKLSQAFEESAQKLLNNNSRTLTSDNFTVAIDRKAMKEIERHLEDFKQIIK
ncbi:MAG: hypothetical protein LBG58_12090 [Planctomycetaceae bacterium]|jgi:hypothetical protein|nr:hypothetical protein [Planctomycetaceae bacterium]